MKAVIKIRSMVVEERTIEFDKENRWNNIKTRVNAAPDTLHTCGWCMHKIDKSGEPIVTVKVENKGEISLYYVFHEACFEQAKDEERKDTKPVDIPRLRKLVAEGMPEVLGVQAYDFLPALLDEVEQARRLAQTVFDFPVPAEWDSNYNVIVTTGEHWHEIREIARKILGGRHE